jgi:hypothetical protein
MSEIIVREITPRDRPAKYGGVDLGPKENLSRGAAAVATLRRDLPGGTHQICVTFLADTYHNRATLLERAKNEKYRMEIFIRGDDGKTAPLTVAWLEEVFGDIQEHVAKIAPSLPPGYSADDFDAPDHHPDGSADFPISVALGAENVPDRRPKPPKPQPGPKTTEKAKGSAAKPNKAAPAPMPGDDAEVSIASVKDFLRLPMREQMMALEAGMPQEMLQEIATSDSPSLEMDVKNEAFRRLSE